jgi:hypothetical protein
MSNALRTFKRENKKMVAANEETKKVRMITMQGLTNAFWKLLSEHDGKMSITCEKLSNMPKGAQLRVKHNEETDAFDFEALIIEEQEILVPKRKLII